MNSSSSETDAVKSATAIRQPGKLPGRKWWFLWLILVIAMVVSRSPDLPDRAIGNVVLVIAAGVLVISMLLWLLRFSGYPKWMGRGLLGLICLVAVCVPAVFRVESWHGSLQPELAFRWAPRHDEELSAIDTNESSSLPDLSLTSEVDFPQFLGANRNSVISRVELNRDWSTPPEQLWKQPIGAGWSGFAAVNGYGVTLEQRGSAEILACYEIVTGKAVWTQAESTRHESVLGYVGPRSTPTIHDGHVYALGATGRLRCVNGADGSVIWSRNLFAENGWDQATAESPVPWGRAASPLIVDDKVIVPLGGPSGGPFVTLIAFDAETGAEVWRGGEHQISYASPQLLTIAGVRQIVNVNEDFISSHAVESGQQLWEHAWPGKSNANASNSQPLLVGDNRVYCSKGYTIGSELIEVSRTPKTLVSDNSKVEIGSADESTTHETTHESTTGEWSTKSIWTSRTMKTKFSNVAFRDGYAYGLDDGVLACQDIETGQRKWKRGRYGYGQTLLVGDTILVLDEDGTMHMVDASPDGHLELGQFQAIDGQTWNTICLYGDLLLVRNGTEAACFRLPLR